MNLLRFLPFLLLAAGGIAARLLNKNERQSSIAGASGAIAGAITELFLASPGSSPLNCEFQTLLANHFLLPVAVLAAAGAFHAIGYMQGHGDGRIGDFWLFYSFMTGSMFAVLRAGTLIGFLFAWEFMGLFSFLLVAFERKSRENVHAAWVYLLSCQAGGLLILLLLAEPNWGLTGTAAVLVPFLTGMAAFGLKIGFPFLHVWLPEAHPAAPAPVSAVMSGAMIPLGFYGIFRFVPLDNSALSGWTFFVLGIAGAFGGILYALAQNNLKKLLAYSSVENMGIVSLGFGLGFLGLHYHLDLMAFCGFSGAFLHILNHAFLKGTLFLGAGSVLHGAHTLELDKMGGLFRKMPRTASAFLCSALGICGLPPFCGFAGELLIYLAGFDGIRQGSGPCFGASFAAVCILAVTGGLACAALAKACSGAFQGEPRSTLASECGKEKPVMVFAVYLLLAGSVALVFLESFLIGEWMCPFPVDPEVVEQSAESLGMYGFFAGLLTVLYLLLNLFRKALPGGRSAAVSGTWDCGYARPTARMEYTATAFTQPLTTLFDGIFRQKRTIQPPEGLFPEQASFESKIEDAGNRILWKPLFVRFGDFAEKIHRFQSGKLHFYLLIMILALLLMLCYGFWAKYPAEKPFGAGTIRTEVTK